MQRVSRMRDTGGVLAGFRKILFGDGEHDVSSGGGRLLDYRSREYLLERDSFRNRIRELEQERENLLAELCKYRSRTAGSGSYLEALEATLSDPYRAHNIIAYYQLRGLWASCRREIATTVRELTNRYGKKEREGLLARFREEQDRQLRDLQDQLHWLDIEREHLVARRRELEADIKRYRMPWHLGRRRKLRSDIGVVDNRFPPLDDRRRHLLERIEAIRDRPPPTYAGLSLQARRQINLSAIALAQYFYLFFLDDDLGALARTAHEKTPAEVDFGTPRDCETLTARIRELSRAWRNDRGRMKKVGRRARFLATRARYGSDGETVPTLESMDSIVSAINEAGNGMQEGARRVPANVLEFDYWNVNTALLHS